MIKYRYVATVTIESTMTDEDITTVKKNYPTLQDIKLALLSNTPTDIVQELLENEFSEDVVTVTEQSRGAWEVQNE